MSGSLTWHTDPTGNACSAFNNGTNQNWSTAKSDPRRTYLAGTSGSENYTSALPLTYFLYHMHGNKDAAGIIAWLRDIEKGAPTDQAARTHLLAGRSVAKLEADLLQAYKNAGIELVFIKRDGAVFEE